MKMFCVQISYIDYALERPADVVALLDIVRRMRALDPGYETKRTFAVGTDVPLTGVSLIDVQEAPVPAESAIELVPEAPPESPAF